MVESGKLWDGFGTGLPDDDSFQNFIDILDFPMESLEEDDSVGLEDFQLLGPIPSDILHGYNPVSQANGQRDFQPNDCVPRDANSERKHLPGVTEISSTKVPRDSSQFKESSLSQTPSPVSVLESMFTSPELLIPVRPRTKHQQRPTFTKWPLISLVTPENKARQMKKRKMSQISNDYEILENPFHISSRKCSHCQVTETPQWREGPMGPKTLCNACGVRYRSGRLFPEYRPAASPTFVPSLHSNSHKKVIQMRNESIREPFQGSSG